MGGAEMEQDVWLALEACQQLGIVREFNVHDFYSVDTVVFRITRNIDSCKAAPSQLINEFVPPLDDTTYHVATHAIDSSSKASPCGYYTSFSNECHRYLSFIIATQPLPY